MQFGGKWGQANRHSIECKHFAYPMYQYDDRLTQLFTKHKYVWLWLQCFDHFLGHHQAYIITEKV
jgi:hypothetical protein